MKLVIAALALVSTGALASTARAQSVADEVRRGDFRAVPVTRIALGPVVALAPDAHAELALDATVGATAARDLDWDLVLNVEAGYSYESGHGPRELHAGNLTAGFGYGMPFLMFTFQPRLLVGAYGGELAIGMRNGVAARFAADIFSAEVAHQVVSTTIEPAGDDLLRHDVRLMLGFNPAPFVYGILELDDALN